MAGASFVPLSPDFPVERLRFMIAEAQVGVLVLSPALSYLGSSLDSLPFHFIPSIGKVEGPQGDSQLEGVEKPNCVAYVIFTSGSTGRPKGVVLSHRALLSHLMPYIRVLGLGAKERVLLTSSFTFDMAYSQIFGALLSGACLVLTKENPMTDPRELLEILQQNRISFSTLVPSVLSSMIHLNATPFSLPALRHLGLGGEAFTKPLTDLWKSCLATQVLLHNRYGPTECAINALLFGPMDEQQREGDVPIGWPSCHRHISLESSGELILAGLGLALGYVSAPVRVGGPFRENLRGAGLQYHTGDLACRVENSNAVLDGRLKFIGRRDSQVKLQGQRIELTEIEETICKLPEVDACVVVAASGSLVAFIPPGDQDVIETVRSHCEKLLPRVMVPQIQLLNMTAWPRTNSGKIDRSALVALVTQHSEAKAADATAATILLEACCVAEGTF